MAAHFGLLEINQDITEQPRTFVKKSVAMLMLRRLEAERVGKRLIRRLAIKARALANSFRLPAKAYIPSTLPHSELPGLKLTELNPVTLRSERLLARMAQQFVENQA